MLGQAAPWVERQVVSELAPFSRIEYLRRNGKSGNLAKRRERFIPCYAWIFDRHLVRIDLELHREIEDRVTRGELIHHRFAKVVFRRILWHWRLVHITGVSEYFTALSPSSEGTTLKYRIASGLL